MSGAHLSQKQPQHVSLRLLVIITTVVFLVVAAAAGFFAMQFFALKSDTKSVDEATSQRLVGDVGKIYMLPEGEPTVARIEDKDKLGDQTFFAKAQNGDFVLIYTDAQLALLYREQDKKLVNVGPIAMSSETPADLKPVDAEKPKNKE